MLELAAMLEEAEQKRAARSAEARKRSSKVQAKHMSNTQHAPSTSSFKTTTREQVMGNLERERFNSKDEMEEHAEMEMETPTLVPKIIYVAGPKV